MKKPQGIHYLKTGQQGSVLIIMVLILIVGVAAVMLDSIGVVRSRPVEPDPVTKQGLITAKEGLLAWASMRGMFAGWSVSPGMLPFPDRRTGGGYDGLSDCPPLTGSVTSILRLGKLPAKGEVSPCRGLGDGGADTGRQLLDARDSSGEMIWYAASVNLFDDLGLEVPLINPRTMTPSTGWLTVCNQDGKVLSNQVAFVVIAPGPVLPGQNRAGAALPRNFLEAYALPATGDASCNSASESNYDSNDIYITNSGRTTLFNDQLLYVTKEEYFGRVTASVAKHAANALARYANAHGGNFPDSAFSNTTDGDCVNGTAVGLLPTNTCHLTLAINFMDEPLEKNGWYGALIYQVDASHQKATINFTGCSNITYTYQRSVVAGAAVYNFKATGKKCLDP